MVAHHLRYLWYLLAGTSALPALRLGRAWWDNDYRRDGLARTEGDVERPRHLLVAGFARHYAPGGSILDIGCGTAGVTVPLRAYYAATPFRYVGLDCSEVALERAAARWREHGTAPHDTGVAQFVQADFDEYPVQEPFDAIIFSESLYYAPDPSQTVRRYAEALRDGGIMIVSMWARPSRARVWKALDDVLRERSRCRLLIPRRPAWDIVVYGRV